MFCLWGWVSDRVFLIDCNSVCVCLCDWEFVLVFGLMRVSNWLWVSRALCGLAVLCLGVFVVLVVFM